MTWSHHQQRSRRAPKGQGLRHLKIQAGRPTLESSDDDSAAEESSEIAAGGSGGSQPGQPAGDGAGAGEPPSENPVELPVVATRDYFMHLGPSEVHTRQLPNEMETHFWKKDWKQAADAGVMSAMTRH